MSDLALTDPAPLRPRVLDLGAAMEEAGYGPNARLNVFAAIRERGRIDRWQ